MKSFRIYRDFLFLLAGIFLSSGADFAAALGKPANVTALYDGASDRLVVEWDRVGGAAKYKVFVKDLSGMTIVSSSTDKLIKKFPAANFQVALEYKVQVQATSNGTKSKLASKSYFHTLSRPAGKGVLLTANTFARTGNYYLPPKFEKKARPLLVGLHGQGGAGDSMISAFSKLAEEFGFIIVAPSSGLMDDNTSAWLVGTFGSVSSDYIHIRNCIDEVLSFKNVTINPSRVLAVGYSAGGAVAPYFATSNANTEFTHFGVLHGGVIFNTLGDRIIPAWLSTGTSDPLRPPAELQAYQTALTALGFNAVYTEYSTDHALANKELRGIVEWWLDK